MRYLLTALWSVSLVFTLVAKDKREELYKEKYRPQCHFTPEKNWHNDPN